MYKLYLVFRLMDQIATQAVTQYHIFDLTLYAQEAVNEGIAEAAVSSYFASLYATRDTTITAATTTLLMQ
jgi:hypothetical protein